MQEPDNIILKKATYDLVVGLRLTEQLKRTLVSSNLITADQLDSAVSKNNDDEDSTLSIIQNIRKNGNAKLETFLDVLHRCGQDKLADTVERYKDKCGFQTPPQAKAKRGEFLGDGKGANGKDRCWVSHETGFANGAEQKTNSAHAVGIDPSANRLNATNTTVLARAASSKLQDLRREVLRCYELDEKHPSDGDIMVTKDYRHALKKFAHGRTDTPPGPLPIFEDRPIILKDTTTCISPHCAAELSRIVGGKPQYSLGSAGVFRTMVGIADLRPRYVMMGFCVKPHGREEIEWWLSADDTLKEALTMCLTVAPRKVKTFESTDDDEELSLDVTVLQHASAGKPSSLDVWI